MKSYFITAGVFLSALFGGMQFFIKQPAVLWGWIIFFQLVFTIGLIVILGRQWTTDLWLYLLWPLAALVISMIYNFDINEAAELRVIIYVAALAALLTANRFLKPPELYRGLWLAALIWPAVWGIAVIAGWRDNVNIMAFWSLLFLAAWLYHPEQKRFTLYMIPHLLMFFFFRSMGALMGLIVIVFIKLWPVVKPKAILYIGQILIVFILAGSFTYSGRIRFHFWNDAVKAFALSPAVGIGPGGIDAREIIFARGNEGPPPSELYLKGGNYQVHAHNFLITWLTETGLLGMVYLGIAAWRIYATRDNYKIERWQLAFLAGILAWSLVDEPLFWPGPLVILALVVGTIQQKGTDYEQNNYLAA